MSWQEMRERWQERNRERSMHGRDIGTLPTPLHPGRRQWCERNLHDFCLTYLPNRFPLPFGRDHLKMLQTLQRVILQGGQYAVAMQRGGGKTTLVEAACVWAIPYGHRSFIVLIGATDGHAEMLLESVKTEWETNDLLAEDFPEIAFPVRMLEGIGGRCLGQTCNGESTRMEWNTEKLIFPTLPGSKASGAMVRTVGITGSLRGMSHTRSNGSVIRPDLVIPDDPQTDQSAESPTQNRKRERILSGAVLGLAGPKKKIAAVMPCTVIQPGDMADRILDRNLHPEWQGERYKMLDSFPENMTLWEQYNEIRKDGLKAGEGIERATRFYENNRTEMDKGAAVSWEADFNCDEESALQHAMNLFFEDERAFMAERQNTPMSEQAEDELKELTADEIASKLSGAERGLPPLDATRLTCGIDVQQDLLFYTVSAWNEEFGGSVIDYGTWPRQSRSYFQLRNASPTIGQMFPGKTRMAAVYEALRALTGELLGLRFGEMKVERGLIDANWGEATDAVYQFCRESVWAHVLLPSHGTGIGPSKRPMSDWTAGPQDRKGLNWHMTPGKRRQRHVSFDANWWKSFVADRLRTGAGEKASLNLFGDLASRHQLFADHLTSEKRVRTYGQDKMRMVEVWEQRPDKRDNHWWDCLVLSAVGASFQGLLWSADPRKPAQKPKVPEKVNVREEAERKRREFEARRRG